MAYIGEMQYLTIGNNTYSLPTGGEGGGGIDVEVDPVFSASPAAGITAADITNWNGKGSGTVTSVGVANATNGGLSVSDSPITLNGTITIGHSNVLSSAQTTQAVYPIKIDKNGHISAYGNAVTIPTKTSDLTNDSGFITSYTDEKLKWTASTSSNTYYPLQSTSTATTSTANTLNGISFYQYYNTAGGYRRLDLGNSTAYKSTGGAYGTIRLYGAAATYYGDLVPGVLGTTSGDGHISANRTWTLPNKTGTVALTSDIPTIPTNISAFTNDAGYLTSYTETDPTVPSWAKASTKPSYTASEVGALPDTTTIPTKTSDLTNDSGFITSYTDEKLNVTSISNSTEYTLVTMPSSGSVPRTATGNLCHEFKIKTDGSTYSALYIGDNYRGQIKLGNKASSSLTYTTLKTSHTTDRTITLPNKDGTVALTSDIPTVPTITLNGSTTTSPSFYAPTSAGTDGYVLKSNGSGAPTWDAISTTDTKNTAGSTNSTSKLYLIGATEQSANPQTYSSVNLTVTNGAITANGDLTLGLRNNNQSKLILKYSDSVYTTIYTSGSNGNVSTLLFGNPTTSSANTGNVRLRGIDGPSTNYDAANKKYVDDSIPSITLNGSSSTSPSFYAPTGAGTSGQYLKSNGSGAPSWANFPTIPSITLNGSSTTSPSFYAPTSVGTSGYVLKSNGSGAPTWTSAVLTDTKNTAGSTNSSSKLYLIGATEQSANPQTYSNSELYFSNGLNSTVSGINNVFTEMSQTTSTIGFRVSDEATFGYGIEASTSEIRMAASQTSSGYVAVDDNGVWITGLVTPSADSDAATKKYVDDVGSSILEITHIVASGGTGANNTWNYRKWSDGTLECWARFYTSSMNINTTTGQLKYGTVSISNASYPVAFTSYPTVTVSGNVTGGNGWVVMDNSNYSTTQVGTMTAYSSASRTGVGVTVNIYAIGKWE